MGIGLIETEADLERFIRDRVPAPQGAKYAETIGNASLTSFTIAHRMGTRDITVTVYDTSAPYAEVAPSAIQHTDEDHVTVTFGVAPGIGSRRVVVQR